MIIAFILFIFYVSFFFLPGRLRQKVYAIIEPIPYAFKAWSPDLHQQLAERYGQHKHLPKGYEKQALLALSFYPELKLTDIEFRLGSYVFAHTCRPKITALLNPFGKRKYLITISDKLEGPLNATLFDSLPFEAQVGVLGHELAHILDYESKSSAALIKDGIGYGFYEYRKAFENATELRTIRKGLGYQLLAWSQTVHHLLKEDGRGDLYYSPEQILSEIDQLPAYQKTRSSEKRLTA
ncbi:MAG: hypothetical protein AAF598_02765 [Bacteroidota bacterium]